MEKLPRFPEEKNLAETLKTPHAVEAYEKLFLGRQIKNLRKKSKLTQRELAKKLKTTQSVVARMEAGHQNFSISTLVRLGFCFGKRIQMRFI